MSRRTALLACVAAFVLTAALRLLNAEWAFVDGIPQVRPLDELYHLKRMAHSAAKFPDVLEFDPDRGVRGAFCPWPPLYDLAAGGVARLLGATSIGEVLSIVVWIPPLVFAAFVAAFLYAVGRRAPIAAAAAAVAMAASPWLVTESWIGSIDHHFLEPLLALTILGAVLAVLGTGEMRAGALLAVAMTAAMFVQTAMLVSCVLAFALCFASRRFGATAIGFAIPAIAIAAYRFTRPDAYPDSAWFLGWPHAALFLGAAVAAVAAWRLRPAGSGGMIATLALGAMIALVFPGMAGAIRNGAFFFGGDPWFARIGEFQPVFRLPADVVRSTLAGFSGGALLVWLLLARAARRRDLEMAAIALFAIVYLLLTLTSRRFMIVAVPLLAVAGAALADAWVREGRRLAAAVTVLLVALPPVIQLAAWWPDGMPRPLDGMITPLRAAQFVSNHNQDRERVLSHWSWGHIFNVLGESPVIVDNFGTMPDPATFHRAFEVLLTTDEGELARYCHQSGVRFIILSHPARGIPQAASVIGRPLAPSNVIRAMWWWRAWEAAPRPTRYFRPVYTDPQRQVIIWQYSGRS